MRKGTLKSYQQRSALMKSIMSLLYEVWPLLRFAQLVGGFPYQVSIDHSKRLVKFSFSWRSFSFFWFVVVTLLQFSSPVVAIQLFHGYLVGRITASTLVIRACSLSSLFFLMLSSRWFILQPKKWSRIIQTLQTIETSLTRDLVVGNSIKFYCYSSIILSILLVSSVSIATGPIYNEIRAFYGEILFGIVVFVQIAVYLNISSCNTLIFASCLLTGKYLDLISHKLTCQDELFVRVIQNKVKDATFTFERCRLLIHTLCNSFKEFKSLLSFPLLLMLTEALINVVILLYIVTYSFIKPTMYLYSIRTTMAVILLFNIILIATVLYASEIPVEKLNDLRDRIIDTHSSSFVSSPATNQLMRDVKLSGLLLELREDRLRLTAMGLFDVGLNLIPAMTGAAVTYLVILLQQVQD